MTAMQPEVLNSAHDAAPLPDGAVLVLDVDQMPEVSISPEMEKHMRWALTVSPDGQRVLTIFSDSKSMELSAEEAAFLAATLVRDVSRES